MDNIQFFTILVSIIGSLAWMISRMDRMAERIDLRLSEVEKDVSMIKGMLIGTKPRSDP